MFSYIEIRNKFINKHIKNESRMIGYRALFQAKPFCLGKTGLPNTSILPVTYILYKQTEG